MNDDRLLSRRELLLAGIAAAGWALTRPLHAKDAEALAPILKTIPSSGERIPVIGLGTNAYSVSAPEEIAARREVLARMPELGGKVIDTAAAYGSSEEVIGSILAELGTRDAFFLASKTPASGDLAQAAALIENSFRRLRVERIDLMQVHSLYGVEEYLAALAGYRQAKKIRYRGITTSSSKQYPDLIAAMRRHELDFIQVDYSIDNRDAAEQVLPLAQERGMAVLVNVPLGGRRGGNLLGRVRDRKLPDFAREIDVESWPQFLLKYVVSHPAVTCAIPGTTKIAHAIDNQRAGRGRLPDAAMRKRMEQYWDEL